MKNFQKTISLFSVMAVFVLSGCVGVAVGAGATAGVAAAREGGIRGAVSDTVIRATINDLWFKHDLKMFAKLNLIVDQGRVLVSGVVQNPEHRVEAVRLAWQAEGVREVINEVKVAGSGGITGFARDAWITTRLRAAMTFDRDVQSINYSIDTVQGVVYLMGLAQSQNELNRVTEIARTIPDVKQVVSYVKLVGEALPPPVSNANKNLQGGAPVQNNMQNNMQGSTLTAPAPEQPYGDSSYSDPYYPPASNPTPLVPEPVQQETLDGGYGGGY